MARCFAVIMIVGFLNSVVIVKSRSITIVGQWDTDPSRKNAPREKQTNQPLNRVKKQDKGALNGVPMPQFDRDLTVSLNKSSSAKNSKIEKVGEKNKQTVDSLSAVSVISAGQNIAGAANKIPGSPNLRLQTKSTMSLVNSRNTNNNDDSKLHLAQYQRKESMASKKTHNTSSKQPVENTLVGKKQKQPRDRSASQLSQSHGMHDAIEIRPSLRQQRKKSPKTATVFITGKQDHAVASLQSTISANNKTSKVHIFQNVPRKNGFQQSNIQQKETHSMRGRQFGFQIMPSQSKTAWENESQWVQYAGKLKKKDEKPKTTYRPPTTTIDNNVVYASEYKKMQQMQQYATPWSPPKSHAITNQQKKNTIANSSMSQQNANGSNKQNQEASTGQSKSHSGTGNGNNASNEGNGQQDNEQTGNNRNSRYFYDYPYYDWWNENYGMDLADIDLGL